MDWQVASSNDVQKAGRTASVASVTRMQAQMNSEWNKDTRFCMLVRSFSSYPPGLGESIFHVNVWSASLATNCFYLIKTTESGWKMIIFMMAGESVKWIQRAMKKNQLSRFARPLPWSGIQNCWALQKLAFYVAFSEHHL